MNSGSDALGAMAYEVGSETLAKAAIGELAMLSAEGTLGDIGQEQAIEMADALGAAPHVAAGFALDRDLSGMDDGSLDGSALRDLVMETFYDSEFTKMQEGFEAESAAEAEEAERVHRDAVIGYSRMTPEDVARAEFDAENGDGSLLLQAEERFYLG